MRILPWFGIYQHKGHQLAFARSKDGCPRVCGVNDRLRLERPCYLANSHNYGAMIVQFHRISDF